MRFRENGWLIGLAALALAGSVACERQPDAARGYAPAAQMTEHEDRDRRITTSVQAQFYTDERVRGRQIDVHTSDAVVTLAGTVDTEQARQRAIELARGVEGVQRVEDNLQVGAPVATTGVDPVAPMAPRTETATADEMKTDPAAERPPADDPERPTDPAVAERPPIDDPDRPGPDEAMSPTWITTTIQAQYFVTPGVAPWKVDVTTSADGVVTLEGEVDTAENRERAVQIARDTAGVTRVEDRLRVTDERDDPAADVEPDRPDDVAETRDRPDAWITTKIQSKYFLDDDVRGRDIDVTTENNVVTLRGTVHSERERRQAVALARNTDGVQDVRDELTVEPEAAGDREPTTPADPPAVDRERPDERPLGERVDDGWITTKVQSQLYLEQDVRGREIQVDTRDGVVTLRGQVESDAKRQLAEQIARETDGVRQVQNQLKVGPAGNNP